MEPKDYPPEQAQHLWQVGWGENVFTFIDAGKNSYLFGPHAIRSAFGTDGIDGAKVFCRRGESVAIIPSAALSQFKKSVIANLGPAHEVLYRLRVTRRSAALAIRGYRKDRESMYEKWDAEDSVDASTRTGEPTK